MKFLVPNYSCLQNPWLRSPFSLSSVLNWICWTPPPKKILGYATDEDKTSLLSFVPGIKKLNVLDKDENAGHFEESQKVWYFSHNMRSVLQQRLLYHRHMIIISYTKTHQQCQIFQKIKQKNCKFPNCVACIIQSVFQIFGYLLNKTVMNNEYSEFSIFSR